MNRRMIIATPLRILQALAILMLLPAAVSLIYKETSGYAFLIVAGATLLITEPLCLFFKPRTKVIYAREGFVIVALTWILMSAVGSLPFVISGTIPNVIDAFFETVSGFTTTGASILTDVEALPHGMLFWRSFTHWLGGMGILVFVMAATDLSDRPMHIMRAEMPGPIVDKLVPRAKDTAKILYIIYMVMTIAEILLLWAGGMPLFDSLLHAFGSAGTGGFGIRADSVAGYSPYLQWVIAVFMFLFGVNFNIYYLLLTKKFSAALKSRELWTYCGIALFSAVVICADIYKLYGSLSTAVRLSAFQVSSIITTTGFSTADFDAWPQLSRAILFLLMFSGASAGSTAGGLKISRIMIIFKTIKREFVKMLHPRTVKSVRLEGKKLDETTVSNTSTYVALYFLCIGAVFLLISLNGFDMETNLTATVACFNNIGPGFAGVGPMQSFAAYNGFSKLILSLGMLLGRLEIFPLLLAFAPSTWKK